LQNKDRNSKEKRKRLEEKTIKERGRQMGKEEKKIFKISINTQQTKC